MIKLDSENKSYSGTPNFFSLSPVSRLTLAVVNPVKGATATGRMAPWVNAQHTVGVAAVVFAPELMPPEDLGNVFE